jgi:hypothetical protein
MRREIAEFLPPQERVRVFQQNLEPPQDLVRIGPPLV